MPGCVGEFSRLLSRVDAECPAGLPRVYARTESVCPARAARKTPYQQPVAAGARATAAGNWRNTLGWNEENRGGGVSPVSTGRFRGESDVGERCSRSTERRGFSATR